MLLKRPCTLSSAERPHSLDHNQLTLQLLNYNTSVRYLPLLDWRYLRCAAEKAACAKAKRPTPTTPFQKDEAIFTQTTDRAAAESREALFNERCVITAALTALPVAHCHFKHAFKRNSEYWKNYFYLMLWTTTQKGIHNWEIYLSRLRLLSILIHSPCIISQNRFQMHLALGLFIPFSSPWGNFLL